MHYCQRSPPCNKQWLKSRNDCERQRKESQRIELEKSCGLLWQTSLNKIAEWSSRSQWGLPTLFFLMINNARRFLIYGWWVRTPRNDFSRIFDNIYFISRRTSQTTARNSNINHFTNNTIWIINLELRILNWISIITGTFYLLLMCVFKDSNEKVVLISYFKAF